LKRAHHSLLDLNPFFFIPRQAMKSVRSAIAVLLLASQLASADGFSPTSTSRLAFQPIAKARISSTKLHFFGRNKDSKEPSQKDSNPIFDFFRKREANDDDNQAPPVAGVAASPVATTATAEPPTARESPAPAILEPPAPVVPPPAVPPPATPEPIDPISNAAALRAQALRIRLEADKLDAKLTLDKIARLERELAVAKRKGDATDDLTRDMENLQRKMRGEPPIPIVLSPKVTTQSTKSTAANTISTTTPVATKTKYGTKKFALHQSQWHHSLKGNLIAPSTNLNVFRVT
jgi:hypothetical protein